MGQSGSVTALTEDDKRRIVDSWSVVRKEPKQHGIRIFVAFFSKYPEAQSKFKAFADVPIEQLSSHPKLAAHAMSVIFALSAIVSALDDDEIVQAMVSKQVENHKPRGVTLAHYKDLQGVVGGYLSTLISTEALQSWQRAFDGFNALVQAHLDK